MIGGIILIGIIISYFYSAEQTKISGYNFGNSLQKIQEELKAEFLDFESKISIWSENGTSTDEFSMQAENHFKKMENLISKYDTLNPPKSFVTSVELFKQSAQSQLASDQEFLKWAKTGNQASKIRADELIQESFEYELAALEKFNAAKAGINP